MENRYLKEKPQKEKLTITISFKQNEKPLYDEIKRNFSCPSGSIKDILIDYFKNNDPKI